MLLEETTAVEKSLTYLLAFKKYSNEKHGLGLLFIEQEGACRGDYALTFIDLLSKYATNQDLHVSYLIPQKRRCRSLCN